MDGGASAAASLVNSALRISQVVYELAAVGEQARDLLCSTKHVARSLETTQTLRRQKSLHLNSTEKVWIDEIMIDASNTLNNVAALVEPVRVDMQTNHGKIGLVNRGKFLFRDSPKIPTQLTKLSITSQSLNTALSILSQREASAPRMHLQSPRLNHRASMASLRTTVSCPPTYDESEFLHRRRKMPISSVSETKSAQQGRTPLSPQLEREASSDVSSITSSTEQITLDQRPSISVQITDEKLIVTEAEWEVSRRYSRASHSSVDLPTLGTVSEGGFTAQRSANQPYRAYSEAIHSRASSYHDTNHAQDTSPSAQHWSDLPQAVAISQQPELAKSPSLRASAQCPQPGPNDFSIPHLPGQSGLELHFPLTPPDTDSSTTISLRNNTVSPALAISPPPSANKIVSMPTPLEEGPGYPLRNTVSEPVLPYPDHRSHSTLIPTRDRWSVSSTQAATDPCIGLGVDLATQMPDTPTSLCPSSPSSMQSSSRDASSFQHHAQPRPLRPPSGTGYGGAIQPSHGHGSGPDTRIPDSLLPAAFIPQTGGRGRRYAWLERHVSQ